MLLTVNNITIERQKRKILQELSFSIEQGELVVFLGSNGAGKSTLLQALVGNLPIQQGQITFKEKLLSEWSMEHLATERAVLSQKTPINFSATLLDIVLMGRYPYQQQVYAPDIDQEIALQALDRVGLKDNALDDIKKLSGGQQQRVQIARVLAQIWESTIEHPKMLYLDEPTAGLDINYQYQLLHLLQQKTIKKELTTVVVLHDINLAAQFASKIILLHAGGLAAIGTPKEVLTPYWIKQVFGVEATLQSHPTTNCLQVSFINNSINHNQHHSL